MSSVLSKLRELGTTRRYLLDIRRFVPLPAMISFCSYENWEAGADYSWNREKRDGSDFFLWQYTLAGRGALRYRKRNYRLEPGSALLLHILKDHHYWLPQGSPGWEFVTMYFHGADVIRLLTKLQQYTGPVLQHEEESPCVRYGLDICLRTARDGTMSQFDNSRMAYAFVMDLLAEKMTPRGADQERPEFVQKVEDYCLDNLPKAIHVDELAAVSGYSRHHFSRLFMLHQRESPAQFLRSLRLRRSLELLNNTRLSIKEVAAECGFNDCSYFCRLFREIYGTTPGAYRENK